MPDTQWAGQLHSYNLRFDEAGAGYVNWRNGSADKLFGSPACTVSGPVITSAEVKMGLAYRGRFFGVFINDRTLRANFWFYQAGRPSAEMYSADNFV